MLRRFLRPPFCPCRGEDASRANALEWAGSGGAHSVLFFVSLLVDGLLAGAIYTLIALAFVVVYKTSRMMNFALGEWAMLGARLVATGLHAAGLGLAGAVGLAGGGTVGAALAFNRLVLHRLVGRPLISVIMVTLGLGMVMRGATPLVFAGIPGTIALPIPADPIACTACWSSPGKLVAAAMRPSASPRLAVLPLEPDRPGAAGHRRRPAGGDGGRHRRPPTLLDHVGTPGRLSVLVGTLWTFALGGGFSLVLVGLKVFPIVIIGGLDSFLGTLVGAMIIGVLESLAAGYLDPIVGGGFSSVSSYLVLLAVLFVRPYGMFGRPDVERI